MLQLNAATVPLRMAALEPQKSAAPEPPKDDLAQSEPMQAAASEPHRTAAIELLGTVATEPLKDDELVARVPPGLDCRIQRHYDDRQYSPRTELHVSQLTEMLVFAVLPERHC